MRLGSIFNLKRRNLIVAIVIFVVFLVFRYSVFSTLTTNTEEIKIVNEVSSINDLPDNDEIKFDKKEEHKPAEIYIPPVSPETIELLKRLNLTNPGHLGVAAELPVDVPEDIKNLNDSSWKKFHFNEFVSRLIPLDRELPDYRLVQGTCAEAVYSKDLLKVSVILSFFNEPFSMLMRTIYSILKRTPPELIEEIILVDDASDDEILLKPLHELLPKLPMIKVIRSEKRLGLMKARILGAKSAKGPVLVVMDSHIEVTQGWLPPLLDPIVKDPHTITLPAVETLEKNTLEYIHVVWDLYDWVGGFTWELMYTWTQIPTPNISETPLPSPTMLGAVFVIRKDYFEYLGYYDDSFELWGGENLELSFKVWMCGGKMYQAMCSHVAHMYRARPYWNDEADVKMRRNTDRLAEVWLDDYKKHYHKQTNFNNRYFGDVSQQKMLRDRLGCKSFEWFLKNVCPGCYVPQN